MRLLLCLSPLLLAAAQAADPPAQVFQTHCSACHAVDHVLVGPSLVEVSGIYRDNPDGFVQWCVKPEHKREGAVEMPSMAHLGEPVLRELHGYIMGLASGKKEQAKSDLDPYAVPPTMVKRPQVMRIFMPEASPASIAVALPGDLSFCFDASECRLRYVWKGGFIDGWPYFKGNGSALAKIDGKVVYREERFPLTWALADKEPPPKFLGYVIDKKGFPVFRYQRGSQIFGESIRPLPDGSGIMRHFETGGQVPMTLVEQPGASVESDANAPQLGRGQAVSFTLTYRWK